MPQCFPFAAKLLHSANASALRVSRFEKDKKMACIKVSYGLTMRMGIFFGSVISQVAPQEGFYKRHAFIGGGLSMVANNVKASHNPELFQAP